MTSTKTFCAQVQHWKQTGEINRNWREYFLNHVLRIFISNDEQPEFIQLSEDKECSNLWPIMPVFYDKREKRNSTFTACIQKALFSDVSSSDLVNFIELNRALGASVITLFLSNNINKPEELYKAVRPYINTGVVEVLAWMLKHEWHNGMFDLGMASSATECVYRNINRARYMSLHDIDEYLIPSKHHNWTGMIDELKKMYDLEKYASLQFANSLFQEKEEQGPSTKCTVPIYFTRYLRDSNPERVHPKVMVDLDTTISAYCHDIKTWKDGINKQLKVPINIGISFHYRKSLGHRVKQIKNWTHDTTVNRYIKDIIPSIEKHSCTV